MLVIAFVLALNLNLEDCRLLMKVQLMTRLARLLVLLVSLTVDG
jgi:hypothetical protein